MKGSHADFGVRGARDRGLKGGDYGADHWWERRSNERAVGIPSEKQTRPCRLCIWTFEW
jgi:hypothetical protein